jgi:defect in organelle trafficking protein DotC
MLKLKQVLLCSSLIMLISGCASNPQNPDNVNTANLSQLETVRVTLNHNPATGSVLSDLRINSLKDSAMSIGAQGGLSWAASAINVQTNKDSKYLDSIYNFNALVMMHGVLPPVLEQGDNSLNLADPATIRIADRTYKIVQQAQFITAAPNWRDYLVLNYPKPSLPDKTLLPKSDEEQNIWRKGIEVGWQSGIDQAYSIFQQNLARLKRDFNGMLLYRKLLQERMISPPFVATTSLGITGNGNDMRVNDQVLRIVEMPKLQTNGARWKAVVVPNS